MSDQPWLCKGQPSSIWFEDQWDDAPYSLALANARDFCDCCPGRAACLKLAMLAEGEDSMDYRAGVYAGLTPQQRHAIFKRGVALSCPEGHPYDPTQLRDGILVCGHCTDGHIAPLPDRGDQWTARHTKLARMTINWLITNVDDLDEIPDALSLSRKLKVGVKDLRRVYQALAQDHVLRRNPNGKLVLRNVPEAVDRWLPQHLRKGLAS